LTQASEIAGALEGGQANLACFEVGGRLYAFEVSQLREIVRWQEITPLPMAPELIEGVIDLRGAVIPVIDLGRALGGDAVNVSTQARIVVIECDGLVFGLGVESAVEVLSLLASVLEDPPALAVQAGYEAVRAVVRREGSRPVLVLSLEHILESVYRSAIRGQGESK
jgi:purine-binding chemotaxis protein CheW